MAPSNSAHPLREKFLSVFQGDVRNNILGFANQLWERESDVFLFMARKAACFFDCLRELGITDVRGQALSDRVLDMDLSFLKDKRVTLVDDCIFTGTTLYRARNAVVKAGCADFATVTLAVNKDTLRPSLLPGGTEADDLRLESPMFSLSDSDCVRQNYDIVRAISIIPRPYDVDFPHSKTSKLTEQSFDRLLSLSGWTAHEATSDFQRANCVRTFTFIPSSATHAKFCSLHRVQSAFATDSRKNLPVAKIRVYARELAQGSWSVRLVPIVMLTPLRNEDVAQALLASAVEPDRIDFSHNLSTPQARYRFLHFLVAHSLLNFFAADAETLASSVLSTGLREDLIEMSFQTEIRERYEKYWPEPSHARLPQPQQEDKQLERLCTPLQDVRAEDPIQLVSESLTPFSQLYNERELPTREFVLKHGLAAAEKRGFAHANRLIEGYTPKRLLSRIRYDGLQTETYQSILIDRMVDLGIAVPTLSTQNGICLRALRHGEDAVFGPAQHRLLMQALNAYLTKRGTDAIWGLELQKFIVLFIQVGIRNNLLDRLYFIPTIDPSMRVVSIKGHLHGPVPVLTKVVDPSGNVDAPYIDGNETHPTWIVTHLVQEGLLRDVKSDRGTQYSLGPMPVENIGERKEIEARKIGRALGTALRNTSLNHDSDLVLLSTCAEPDQQLRALCGEVAIFKERWSHVRSAALHSAKMGKYDTARELLRGQPHVFTALNSGAMKYSWYTSRGFSSTKTRVYSELRAKDLDEAADEWHLLWPDSEPVDSMKETTLWKSITDMGRWIYSLNTAMWIISYWMVLRGKDVGQFTESDVADEGNKVKLRIDETRSAFLGSSSPKFVQLLDEIDDRIGEHDVQDAGGWCKQAGDLLNKFAAGTAELLLEDATHICNAYGAMDSTPQLFPYAVFFDVRPGDHRSSEGLYDVLRQMRAKATKDGCCELPETHNPWRTGYWTEWHCHT